GGSGWVPVPTGGTGTTGRSVLVADHRAGDRAGLHVGERLVDVVDGDLLGDQLLQLELALLPEVEQLGHVVVDVGRAVPAALDGLGEVEPGERHVQVHHHVQARDPDEDDLAAGARGVDGL